MAVDWKNMTPLHDLLKDSELHEGYKVMIHYLLPDMTPICHFGPISNHDKIKESTRSNSVTGQRENMSTILKRFDNLRCT